jgi:hypothetical protein
MSIVQSGTKARLRFNHRGGADGARQLLGVVIEDRIPGDSPLYIDVDQPTALPQSDEGQQDGTIFPAQPFVIEEADRPLVVSAGGVSFRKRIPTLSVLPGAPSVGSNFVEVGNQPAWAAVGSLTPAVPATGLVPKGRYAGFVPAWPLDPNGSVPGSGHRPGGRLLRVRWAGVAEAAEIIDGGSNAGFTFVLQDTGATADARDIAPGSVEITATIGGNALVIRDDGAGRLYGWEATGGTYATGTIDYRTATVTLSFSTATDAVNVLADYEHTCLYLPLDVSLRWDAEMAQG